MTNTVIEFDGVYKKFKRGRKLLKEALLDLFKPGQVVEFWALRNINFSIKKGEVVGIIGPNGSGKSTILRMIANVSAPSAGKVSVKGQVAPLIELGAGFHPELSGRENIYLNGTILGLSRNEIEKRLDDIIEFAELKDYIDTPIKHYSTGMYMRLGFAVAVHTNPDILLVDEILAVGDNEFQKRCIKRMEEFKAFGVTIVFVSHNLDLVKKFCTRVLYIDKCKLLGDGKPKKIIDNYLSKKTFRWGDGGANITNIKQQEKFDKEGNQIINIEYTVIFNKLAVNPIFGVSVRNEDDEEIAVTNTLWKKIKTGSFKEGESVNLKFEFTNSFPKGLYFISPAVAHSNLSENYDGRTNMLEFNVNKSKKAVVVGKNDVILQKTHVK